MRFEEGLMLVEQLLEPEQLTKVQAVVFQQAWQGKSYLEIAKTFQYHPDYIKEVGSSLWHALSDALGVRVTKHNFLMHLKRYRERLLKVNAARSQQASGTAFLDLGEAVDGANFYGRLTELMTLDQWLNVDRCRLVTVLGMGGMGKTALSVRLAKQMQATFDFVIWRSLKDAPPLSALLGRLIQILSADLQIAIPETESDQIGCLIECLQRSRCLLIFDNLEVLFQPSQRAGTYRAGYEAYGELLRRVGQSQHQSCVLLTSREKPAEMVALEGETLPVRTLQLQGLQEADSHRILIAKGLTGSSTDMNELVHCYGGNPLALKISATSIQDLFAGNIADFLGQGSPIFTSIRDLLKRQVDRLSDLERQVMTWIAINREPVTVKDLRSDVFPLIPMSQLLDVVESLRWRSLIEKSTQGFTQQPVVMEYFTEQLIQQSCQELLAVDLETAGRNGAASGRSAAPLRTLNHFALLKATAKDYVRATQIRLIVEPIVQQTIDQLGTERELAERLLQLVEHYRDHALPKGYAVGNLLNLLCYLKVDLTGADFSHCTIWQAYLADADLPQVNFRGADLTRSVFAETFGGLTSVTFSPNQPLLATSDTNGETYLWNIATGKLANRLRTDAAWTCAVTFSPDGNWLASVGDDCRVKLWQVDTGECLQQFLGHVTTVNGIAFSPDGQQMVSGSQDGTLRLWQIQPALTDPCLRVFEGHEGRVWGVALSPDGKTMISGSEDCTLKIWDVATGNCLTTLTQHKGWVKAVAFSPDGKLFASGSFDGTIRLWHTETCACLRTLTGHLDAVTMVDFSPDGHLLASGSYDQMVKLWDVQSGQCIRTYHEHSNRVLSVAFSPSGDQIASGGDDHATKIWDIQTQQCIRTWKGHTNSVLSLSVSPDRQYLATGHQDQTIKIWQLQTGQVVKTLRGHMNRIWSVAFAPAENPLTQAALKQGNTDPLQQLILASGSGDRTVKIWNARGHCFSTLHNHTSWVWSTGFNAAGNWLISGSCDHAIRLWDVETGTCLQIFEGHLAPVVKVILSPDEQYLISSSADRTIRVWEIATGDCVQVMTGHQNSVWSLAMSPDGQLASCSYDQTIRFWNWQTGECTARIEAHPAPIVELAFSSDGKWMASGSFDCTIKLWDLQTKTCKHTLKGHTALVPAMTFVPNPEGESRQDLLISGSFDETVKIWDIETQTCLRTLRTPRPYELMNIAEVSGITETQRTTLEALGAIIDFASPSDSAIPA